MSDIKEALRQLDPQDDAQWTEDGLPRVDAVAKLVGNPELTRAQITEADSSFCRETAVENAEEDDVTEQVRDGQEEKEGSRKVTLKEQIDELDDRLVELIETENRLNAEIARVRAKLVHLKMRYERQTPQDDTKTRMTYIKQQHQIRMQRAGLTSKLDQAMGVRKSQHGGRPSRGLKK